MPRCGECGPGIAVLTIDPASTLQVDGVGTPDDPYVLSDGGGVTTIISDVTAALNTEVQAAGVLGYATDTNVMKVFDGTTPWSDLPSTAARVWRVVTNSYALTYSDYGVILTTSLTGRLITLPSATLARLGHEKLVKNNSGVSLTVAATAGTVEVTTVTAHSVQRYVSDGTNWLAV